MNALPLLGFMLGDCTGIGPEQCARVLADRRLAGAARLLVVGDARVLAQGARDAGVTLRPSTVSERPSRMRAPSRINAPDTPSNDRLCCFHPRYAR